MAIVTGDRYLDLLASFVEKQADGLVDGSLVLKLNPVGLHYVQTRLDALHELDRLRAGAPVDYLRAYISDLGDHRVLEQLARVLNQLPAVKVVSVLPGPVRDPSPLTLSAFGNLKSLELRGCDLSTTPARGLMQLRPILERLICHNSADALRHIFVERIREVKDSQVWTRLTYASCASNNMVLMDDSLQLLPAIQFLDLSRNRFAKAANLQQCSKLKFLDLGFNQLRDVSSLKQIKSQITKLVLKNNALVSVRGIASLKTLQCLDLSNNLISKFKEIQPLATIPSLETLILEGNPISASPFYREEVFSFFQDPNKISLDGRKIMQSEVWTVKKIIAKRIKMEALYGSYAPAETTGNMQGGNSSRTEHSSARTKRKPSRLASIQDAESPEKESIEEDDSPGYRLSRDIKERRQDISDEGDELNVKFEAIQLMEKAEALKEESSTRWLQELWVFLDNNDPSSRYILLQNENENQVMDLDYSKLQRILSRRRRRRHIRSLKKDIIHQMENESSLMSAENSMAGAPGLSAKSPATSDYDNGLEPREDHLLMEENVNMAEFMHNGLSYGYVADEEQTSMDESLGSWKFLDEVVEARAKDRLRSPPHYHEDVLLKRQNLEDELLRISLDSGCALSSSDSDTSSDDSLVMPSSSSKSNNSSPRNLSTENWQGHSFMYSKGEPSMENYSNEVSISSDAEEGKGESLENNEEAVAIHMLNQSSMPKETFLESVRSSNLNPACTADILANAGGGENGSAPEMIVSKNKVKKTRRARTVQLYTDNDVGENNSLSDDHISRTSPTEYREAENMGELDAVLDLSPKSEDAVQKYFRLKIANQEGGELYSGHVKCSCIRLWEKSPVVRNINLLWSNTEKIYMLAESDSHNLNTVAKGSDHGLFVIASHSIQEVRKIMVGLGLQAMRIDIGHSASYLLITRSMNVSIEILNMFRRRDSLPDIESWEQKQLSLFEESILRGASANVLMYLMVDFCNGDPQESKWIQRSMFLTARHIFVCVEDLTRFGGEADDSKASGRSYFVMESAADIYELLDVGRDDECLTLKFSKVISSLPELVNYQNGKNYDKRMWRFKGVSEQDTLKLIALLHGNQQVSSPEPGT